MKTDFDNWLIWYKKIYPSTTLSDAQLKAAYDAHYHCNCQSCTYRKERGTIPIYTSTQGCKLDPEKGDLNYVPENYTPV